MASDIGRSFGIVDQAVKSITTVQEYLNVGIEITNEVAMDFVENTDKADAEKQLVEFRDVMLDFVRMERDLKQFQEAVEFVKSQAHNTGRNMEESLDEKLAELKQKNTDKHLLEHVKVQEFNQKIHEILSPDEPYQPQQSCSTSLDDDIEMTQTTINTKCPYTGKEMLIPMKNKICGHNYEKEGILQYIHQRKKKARCPLGGCSNEKPIELSDLEENKELKRYIDRKNRQAKKGR